MLARSTLLAALFWLVLAGAVRAFAIPPEACRAATPAQLRATAEAAVGWIERAQAPDGSYVYIYRRDADTTDAFPAQYNEVRHAGVTMSLYLAAARLDDPQALASADGGLRWMLDHLLRRDGWAALLTPDGSRAGLGASALMLAGLADRRLATGDPRYDALMRELGAFLVALQHPDGRFDVIWDVAAAAPVPEERSFYFPGEAFYALALLDRAFPGEPWGPAAHAAADYLVTRRDADEDVLFPPWADQWTAYGLAMLAPAGLSETQREYARRLAGRFGMLARFEAQTAGGGLVARVHGGPSRAAAAGTWLEGLAALWRVTQADPTLADLAPAIERRLACLGGIMVARQAGAAEARGAGHPGLVRGAWFTDGETRMDDQQHPASGLLDAAEVLRSGMLRSGRAP